MISKRKFSIRVCAKGSNLNVLLRNVPLRFLLNGLYKIVIVNLRSRFREKKETKNDLWHLLTQHGRVMSDNESERKEGFLFLQAGHTLLVFLPETMLSWTMRRKHLKEERWNWHSQEGTSYCSVWHVITCLCVCVKKQTATVVKVSCKEGSSWQ